jgi:integrase
MSGNAKPSQMITNDFMLQLHQELTAKTYGPNNDKKLSESTINSYLRTLWLLNDQKPFKSLTFLKVRDDIDKKVAKYAESTQKTIYATLASVLSLYKDKSAYKAIYKFYHDKMNVKVAEASKVDTAEPTKKQEENWITWEEVNKIRNDLWNKSLEFSDKKTLSPSEYHTLLELLILSLYIDVPPRRNQDYLAMKIIKTKAQKFAPPLSTYTDQNFLVVRKGIPEELVFNTYKTAKKYGSQNVIIPREAFLVKIINLYLKHRPKVAGEDKELALLVNHNGSVMTQANAITRLLNGVFNKKIGSSMLRHIYLSHKMNISDMKQDAQDMGHSLQEQQKYLKTIPPPTEGQVEA